MTGGSIIALLGAALALLGPLFLPFITVDEAEVAFHSYDVFTGQLSLALALVTLGLVVWLLKQRTRALGWLIAVMAVVQLGLMAWTFSDVWNLTPCAAAGGAICDAATGGLLDQTLVTLDWGLAVVVVASIAAVFGGLIVVTAHPEYDRGARFLRVLMSWQGTILYEKVFFQPGPVTVGESDKALFQLAAGGMPSHTLLTPGGDETWTLDLPRGVDGELQVDGQERDATHVSSVTLRDGDGGRLFFDNDVQLAFHFVGAETAILGGASQRENVALAVSFAIVAAALLVILTTALLGEKDRRRRSVDESPYQRRLEHIELTMEMPQEMTDEEVLQGEEDDTTGKTAGGEEGVFGDPDIDTKKKSKVPKMDGKMVDKIDVRKLGIAKVLGGAQALQGALGDVLAGDTGALSSKMAVAMSGDGSELVIGHGSGGMGFRHTGTGGGGTGGYGRIRGLGPIDTGGGVGRKPNVRIGRKPTRRPPIITTGHGIARGGCDRGHIAKNVKRRASALRACYETQLLSRPNLRGKVTVRWTIDTQGKVRGERLLSNTLKSPRVTDCVLRAVRRIRFQKPDAGICVVQWPFIFVPGR